MAVLKPNIETGCGASEVPESSFEGQQKQFVAPWEVAWQSNETPSKAAGSPIDQVRQFPAEKIIPYLRQNN